MKVENRFPNRPLTVKQATIIVFRITLLTTVFFFSIWRMSVSADEFPKQVLMITSYHQGDSWNDAIVSGVQETFYKRTNQITLFTEHLDIRRNHGNEHAELFSNYLKVKYSEKALDLVIISDDAALTFFISIRSQLFRDVPAVFCGINNFKPEILAGHSKITGVNEEISMIETMEMAFYLFPDARNIVAVCDDKSVVGQNNLNIFRNAAGQFKDRAVFSEALNLKITDVPEVLGKLSPDTLLFRLNNLFNAEDNFVSIQETMRVLSKEISLPIFTAWDFDMGLGAIGGVLVSAMEQGRKAAVLSLQILEGTPADQIPVIMESPNMPVIDFQQIRRFGLTLKDLPEDAQVINIPDSLWDQYKTVILFVVFLTFSLMVVVILQTIHLRKRYRIEKRLKESERFLQILLESIPLPVFYKDVEGRYKGFNKAFETFFGRPKSELIGCSVFDINPPELARIYHAKDSELLKKISTQIYESNVKNAFGELRDVIFHKATLTDTSGAITGLVGAIMDITERKRAEEENRRFRTISDNAVYGMAIADLQGNLLYANRFFANIHGYEPDQLIGKPLSLLHNREQLEAADRLIASMMREGHFPPTTVWHSHQDDTVFPMMMSGMLIKDDYDNPQFIAASAIDMTAHHKADESLKDSEQMYRTTFDAIPDSITVTRQKDGRYKYVNDGFCHITGYSRDEVIGKTPVDINLYVNHSDREKMIQTLRQSQVLLNFEIHFRRKNGTILDSFFSARPIVIDGEDCLIALTKDVTAFKRAEEEKAKLEIQLLQAQKMESVGRLAGGVAHDFNNMLGVILGHAELALLQADEKHELYADLNEIQKAAQRSAKLTKQLLTFARKEIISPKQIDLNDTVESMLNMLRRLIGEDIDLSWKPAPDLWPVKMDSSQIDQILANLCVNARDAIADVGNLTIETGMKSFDAAYCADHAGFIPGDFVLLAVSDNGCGMDKETLDNLFEPFFTTKEVGKGTGLGLATIYGIVKQNNGFINVYSEPGQGTTFRIYLPRCSAGDGTSGVIQPEKPVPTGNETILLVEDEPAILNMTRMMLERKGYSVLSAATPAEAIDMANACADKIHLLMTDVVMPEMNGRDMAGKITDLYPDIGLLFMSGYTANVIAHQGVLDEGVAFIQKPFSMKDLAVKVREVLDKASDGIQ